MAGVSGFLGELLPDLESSQDEFSPYAFYDTAMDYLIYVNQDCSYRADRIGPLLTVLWHPVRDELVGIKIKGFKWLFNEVRGTFQWTEDDFHSFMKWLEIALVAESLAERILDSYRRQNAERVKTQVLEFSRSIPPIPTTEIDKLRMAA